MTTVSHKDLELRHAGGACWELLDELELPTGDGSVTVPVGFRTNLASIPRPARVLISVVDDHASAAVGHDWLYLVQSTARKEADRLFRRWMDAAGVPWWKRTAMYAAVRVGGWVAWRLNRDGNDCGYVLEEMG